MAMAVRAADAGRGYFGAATVRRLDHLFDTLMLWHQRAFTRRELARLDDRMLHDIGLSHADVENEVAKPFWRP